MATHSSILAWKNSMDRGVWLESVGAQRVRHDQTTEHTHTHTHTQRTDRM